MTLERLVLIIIWVVMLISIVFGIPKNKRREATIAFLACLSISWVNVLLHVFYGLLSFPVREFPKATDLPFTTDFIMYPLICGFYYIYEPKSSKLLRFAYLAGCISGLTFVDFILATYTNLIQYIQYSWFWTWINFFLIFVMVNLYCKWFLKPGLFREDRRTAQ